MFEPILVTFQSKSELFQENNCISQGKYCSFNPDEDE